MNSPKLIDGQEVTVVLRGTVASQYLSFVAAPAGREQMAEIRHTGGMSTYVPEHSPDVDIIDGHVTAADLEMVRAGAVL